VLTPDAVGGLLIAKLEVYGDCVEQPNRDSQGASRAASCYREQYRKRSQASQRSSVHRRNSTPQGGRREVEGACEAARYRRPLRAFSNRSSAATESIGPTHDLVES
jgi:hypothetical protein